jgi:hypothetical protein
VNFSRQRIEKLAILNAWVTSGIVLLNMLLAFIIFNIRTFESMALIVFVSGTLGGAASNYKRLQEAYVQQLGKAPSYDFEVTAAPEDQQQIIQPPTKVEVSDLVAPRDIVKPSDSLALSNDDKATILLLKMQIFLSPVFGGLFAFVLYGVFAAGIIQGEIFPAFRSTQEDYTTPYDFADQTLPATNEDAAKAILWAFIAGFAEGFVPNFIDKLVKDNEGNKETK